MSTLEESLVSAPPPSPTRYYKISVLCFGFLRMWRAFVPMTIAVIANVVFQMLLVVPYTPTAPPAIFVPLAILSWAVFVVTYSVIVASAILATEGRVTTAAAVAKASANFWRFALWSTGYFLIIWLGLSFWTIPGLIFGAVFAFVPLTSIDGWRNPVAANFRVIGRRVWRFLITLIITVLILLIFTLVSILNGFFVTNFWVAGIQSLITGLLACWLFTAFALIYKSAMADADTGSEDQPAV